MPSYRSRIPEVASEGLGTERLRRGQREAADVGRAAAVNSALGAGRRRRLLDKLAAHPPSLFVVDEALCVSRWWPTSRDSRRRHRPCGHPQGDRGPG